MFKPHQRHYAIGFLLDAAIMTGFSALPFYIFNQLGGGAALSGIVGGLQSVSYGALCLMISLGCFPVTGRGLRVAAWGTAFFAVTFCGSILTRNPWFFGALVTLANAGMAFVWPALHAWLGAEPDIARRNKLMSRFNISWGLGFAVGPLLAGPLYVTAYWLPFAAVFVICCAVIVLILLAPDERVYFATACNEVAEERESHDRASELHLYAAWMACVVGAGLGQVTRTVFTKRLEDLVAAGQLRWFFEDTPSAYLTVDAATKYMWLAFAIAVFNALTFFIMGRTHGWHHKFPVLAAMQVGAAIAFWVLGSTTSLAVMLVCFAAVGVAWGGGFFAGVFYSMANPALKHRRAAVNEGAVGLGGLIGSLAFGILAERYGHALPHYLTPAVVAVALFVEYMLLRYAAERQRRLATS